MAPLTEEELQEIKVIAERKHPGRSIADLSDAEKDALFRDFDAQKLAGLRMMTAPTPRGRHVGPYDVYVQPNWGDTLGNAAEKLAGAYMMKRAQDDSALGSQAAGDLAVRAGAEQVTADDLRRQREEMERRAFYQQALGLFR